MLAAQPAVTDAFEVAEDPVTFLGEHREFGAILERLVEGGFIVFADSLAGNCFRGDDTMSRPVDVGVGKAGIERQDGGYQHKAALIQYTRGRRKSSAEQAASAASMKLANEA